MSLKHCILAVALVGCAGAMPILRTIDDIGSNLCLLAASRQPEDKLGGKTAEEWCDIKENLQPFIDEALAAKRAASSRAGIGATEPEASE